MKLASRQSFEPLLFGRYSLPYFLFLIFFAVAGLLLGFALHRYGAKVFYLLLGSAIGLLGFFLPLETAGQVYASFHPAYDVLAWQPDPVVGWKEVPNLNWTWAGHHWYAREFSVPIVTNPLGFRDLPREFRKPEGTLRVVLLGDSFVEAAQVPFERTAGNLLEKNLNHKAGEGGTESFRYEVLNFGVSSYSVGQCLLAWEEYASKFSPDVVFLLLVQRKLERTEIRYETGAFLETKNKRLWIQPTFRFENGVLIREPAPDYGEFVKAQEELIRAKFGGERMRERGRNIFLWQYFSQLPWYGKLYAVDPLTRIQRKFFPETKRPEEGVTEENKQALALNLKIIEELARSVREKNAELVLVNAYYNSDVRGNYFLEAVNEFCDRNRLPHISLYQDLAEAREKGLKVEWKYDGHFNETGNRVFSEAMHRWMIAHPRMKKGHVEV